MKTGPGETKEKIQGPGNFLLAKDKKEGWELNPTPRHALGFVIYSITLKGEHNQTEGIRLQAWSRIIRHLL